MSIKKRITFVCIALIASEILLYHYGFIDYVALFGLIFCTIGLSVLFWFATQYPNVTGLYRVISITPGYIALENVQMKSPWVIEKHEFQYIALAELPDDYITNQEYSLWFLLQGQKKVTRARVPENQRNAMDEQLRDLQYPMTSVDVIRSFAQPRARFNEIFKWNVCISLFLVLMIVFLLAGILFYVAFM